jgi:hypothetical protein
MDTDSYCRDIEAHLCRRNGGHLVRIVGPAFDMVRAWAANGVPLKVALQGIDRRVDRASAAGPRRRPIRLEFCEADVLDAFDAWRRAVGVYRAGEGSGAAATGSPEAGATGETAGRSRLRESLSTHLDRVIVRLTALRAGETTAEWNAALEALVRRLDQIHPATRRARGEARARILAELETLDVQMMDRARACAPTGMAAEAERDAAAELEPFAGRLAPEAFASAHRRCTDRILRDRLRLPTLIAE